MSSLSHHDITMLLLALGILLGTARLLGEIAQRLHQPSVVGEILAGILLGPTFFGALAPELAADLFPQTGSVAIFLDGFTTLAITLFLVVAGMEVDLSTVWRQGGAALRIGLSGMVIPFAIGFAVAWLIPGLLGQQRGADSLVFSLFFATAVSISALPIVAKILMDLNLYRSDFGMVVVASCVLNDLIGWMVFALILGLTDTSQAHALPVYWTIGLTLGFTAFVLTIGRWAFDRALPWIQAHTRGVGGVLAFAMTLALFGAAFTEYIGVHAILGSFLIGVAIGDSSHLREETRTVLDRFISFIFAPLFFASIGLRVNFASNFDPIIVLAVLTTAAIGKFGGCYFGARWAGFARRECRAVGYSMISVGAMGIIVGLLALQYGLIQQRLFVALVIMALTTSMFSGPMIQFTLGRRKRRTIVGELNAKRFIPNLQSSSRISAIAQLVEIACKDQKLDAELVGDAVMLREETMHTGIGQNVAIPHARIRGLAAPIVALGLSVAGVDFDSPDGEPAHIIFLLLTPEDDDGSQLEIMSSISQTFLDRAVVTRVLQAANFTEIRAAMKIAAESTDESRIVSQPPPNGNGNSAT